MRFLQAWGELHVGPLKFAFLGSPSLVCNWIGNVCTIDSLFMIVTTEHYKLEEITFKFQPIQSRALGLHDRQLHAFTITIHAYGEVNSITDYYSILSATHCYDSQMKYWPMINILYIM